MGFVELIMNCVIYRVVSSDRNLDGGDRVSLCGGDGSSFAVVMGGPLRWRRVGDVFNRTPTTNLQPRANHHVLSIPPSKSYFVRLLYINYKPIVLPNIGRARRRLILPPDHGPEAERISHLFHDTVSHYIDWFELTRTTIPTTLQYEQQKVHNICKDKNRKGWIKF